MIIPFYSRFIGGSTSIELTRKVISLYKEQTWLPIVYHAKESSYTEHQVIKNIKTINDTVDILSKNCPLLPVSYALKYSSFNDYNKLDNIIKNIRIKQNTKFIFIDSEYDTMKAKEKENFQKLVKKYKSPTIFKTYQMCRRDSYEELMSDIHSYNSFGIKLVRGAYHLKHNSAYYDKIEDTHNNYNRGLLDILNHIKISHKFSYDNEINLLVATHNERSLALAVSEINKYTPLKNNVYFGQLLGMADNYSKMLVKGNYKVMKYIPYGAISETAPYIVRRLFETNFNIIKHM